MGIRKNCQALTPEERIVFLQALDQLKAEGTVDQFAAVHGHHFSMGIHTSSHFLPWHREFLLRFEAALQALDPAISIPYWDSSIDQDPTGPLWAADFLGPFDQAWGLNRTLGAAELPSVALVETNQQQHDKYEGFWPELERFIHNPPHRWVGGVMVSDASPRDPAFYFHHAWIDLLWVRWQAAHPTAPFVESHPDLGLDDPMMEWPDRTPAHVLDHWALGYSYDIEGLST